MEPVTIILSVLVFLLTYKYAYYKTKTEVELLNQKRIDKIDASYQNVVKNTINEYQGYISNLLEQMTQLKEAADIQQKEYDQMLFMIDPDKLN